MKHVATICVYGEFSEGRIKIKVFPAGSGTEEYRFQNTLREAGYNAELFSLNDADIDPKGVR